MISAPVGQTVTHFPQDMHLFWSTSNPQPCRIIASSGQTPEQRPHWPQSCLLIAIVLLICHPEKCLMLHFRRILQTNILYYVIPRNIPGLAFEGFVQNEPSPVRLVSPLWIHGFYQRCLFVSSPSLQLFFSCNVIPNISEGFDIYQLGYLIFFCKTS